MAPITTLAPWLPVAGAYLLLFAAAGGARFASAQAVMTEMAPERRGTVMALNAGGQQFGIVTGSAIGGLILGWTDYTGLGPAAAVVALVSLVTYAFFVDERRFESGRSSAAEGLPGERPVPAPGTPGR
jgi:predicted MFS family arabinose efflux permease